MRPSHTWNKMFVGNRVGIDHFNFPPRNQKYRLHGSEHPVVGTGLYKRIADPTTFLKSKKSAVSGVALFHKLY